MARKRPAFLSHQNFDGRLRTLAAKASRSVLCRSSSERRRRQSSVPNNPLHQCAVPLPDRTLLHPTENDNRDEKINVGGHDIATPDPPDTFEVRVAALAHSYSRLVQHRRRLARAEVARQSDLSNVNITLRFFQESQERFVDASLALCQQHPELVGLHDTCRTDSDDFRLHYAAWKQSNAVHVETIAGLQRRDNAFVLAAVSLLPASLPDGVNTVTQADDLDGSSTIETMPPLLIDYHEQRGRVAMLEEREIDFAAYHQQQLATYEFLEDQDHIQELSREEIMAEHTAIRKQSTQELDLARVSLAKLERKCREENLDMSEVRRPSSERVRDVADVTNASSHHSRPTSDSHVQTHTDHTEDSANGRPLDRRGVDQTSMQDGRLDRWFNGLSVSELTGESSRITDHQPPRAHHEKDLFG